MSLPTKTLLSRSGHRLIQWRQFLSEDSLWPVVSSRQSRLVIAIYLFCVCACVIYVCAHMYAWVWEPEAMTCVFFYYSLCCCCLLRISNRVCQWAWHSPIWQDKLARNPQEIFLSPTPSIVITGSCLAFSIDSGDLNLSSCACIVSNSPTEPSYYPFAWFLKKLFAKTITLNAKD